MKPWHQRGTLLFRLALWYGLMGSLLVGGFSATLYVYVRERMAQPLDRQLRHDLAQVEKLLEVTPEGEVRWSGRPLPERTPWTTQYPWFEIWDEEGRVVRRLWPFAENRVQQVPTPPAPGRETISVFSVAPDLRLRVLSVPYAASPHHSGWMLRIMRVHEPVGDALGALRWIIILALPTTVLLLVIGGYVVSRQWLRPLHRMARAANQITADNLGARLPIANPRDEAGQLGTQFNVTLDRLEASFNALDRFVADASHELRTPLTTLRSVGEVGLRRGRTAEEYREIIGSMLEEAERLEDLVGRLLELATAEGGAATVRPVELALHEFIQDVINELAILAEARGQRVTLDLAPGSLPCDPVFLRQALQNLVDNAVKFSPEHSTIAVQLAWTEEAAKITISDEGPGISTTTAGHLTERFFRGDPGRSAGGGFGLGLALTKAYMRLLGGELTYAAREPVGSAFQLMLPRSSRKA